MKKGKKQERRQQWTNEKSHNFPKLHTNQKQLRILHIFTYNYIFTYISLHCAAPLLDFYQLELIRRNNDAYSDTSKNIAYHSIIIII